MRQLPGRDKERQIYQGDIGTMGEIERDRYREIHGEIQVETERDSYREI